MRRWWNGLSVTEKSLLVGGAGLGLGVAGAYIIDRRRLRLPGFSPFVELPDLMDLEDDEVDEPEPPGIEYDDHPHPCVPPPVGWDIPGVEALEGAHEDEGCTPDKDLEPKQRTVVPYLDGDNGIWPVDTDETRKIQVSYQDVRGKWHGKWGREFGASRKAKDGGKRTHVGIDLFADPGDVVLAMEDGEVLAALPFYKKTGALYVRSDSGHVVNYGELEHRSWRDYGIPNGIETGHRVRAGQPIARVGLSSTGSHMLHLETFDDGVSLDAIRRGDMQWRKGDAPPEHVLDPTQYLLNAQRTKFKSMIDIV